MNHFLGELTTEEAKDRMAKADYIILPTGSIEQHSIHLPLLTDSIRAEEISNRLLETANNSGLKILGIPTLSYGCSDHHINFSGTISIDQNTYIRILYNIGKCLSMHGAKRFLVINFHGGNKEPITIAGDKIIRDFDIDFHFVHWTKYARERIIKELKTETWGHACEYETSMILHFRPDLVKKDKIQKQVSKKRPETKLLRYFEDYYPSGGKGDPNKASAEFAAGLVEDVNKEIIEILKNDLILTD
jgi:creatinine amidohydrolase